MKRIFSISGMMILLMVIFSSVCLSAEALSEEAKGNEVSCSSYSGQITRVAKTVLGNGLECTMTFKCSPEVALLDDSGNIYAYRRTASVTGVVCCITSGNHSEKILTHKVEATFTYDKKSYVIIANPDEDVVFSRMSRNSNKWKATQNCEIIPAHPGCIVSEVCTMYKVPKRSSVRKLVDNSHIDIICSVNGEIGYNSKVH